MLVKYDEDACPAEWVQPQGADLPWVKLDKGPGSYIFEPEDTHFLEFLPTFS